MKRMKLNLLKRAGMLGLGLLLRLPWSSAAEVKLRKSVSSGVASFYADKFNGRTTANGERFSNQEMTAAHNSLPLGTLVKVTNEQNGKSVMVRITDRLAKTNHRIIDLTQRAAKELGFLHKGIAHVKVEVSRKETYLEQISDSWVRPFYWQQA